MATFNRDAAHKLWQSTQALLNLYNEELAIENRSPSNYGLSRAVPLVFFDAVDSRGNTRIAAETPMGVPVMVFGEMKIYVQTGVLYRDLTLVRSSGNYFVTNGVDFRTAEYWKLVASGLVVPAVKEYTRQAQSVNPSNTVDLVSAKNMVSADEKLLKVLPHPDIKFDPNKLANQVSGEDQQPSYDITRLINELAELRERVRQFEGQNIPEMNRTIERLRREVADANRRATDAHTQLARSRSTNAKLESEARVALLGQRDALAEVAKLRAQLKSQSVSPTNGNGKLDINIWKVLGCAPTDGKGKVKRRLFRALRIYHQDNVRKGSMDIVDDAGVVEFSYPDLLGEYAKEITLKLLELKERL